MAVTSGCTLTLKRETASPPRHSRQALQRAFDAFRIEYNLERPHESLKMRRQQGRMRREPPQVSTMSSVAQGSPRKWQSHRSVGGCTRATGADPVRTRRSGRTLRTAAAIQDDFGIYRIAA